MRLMKLATLAVALLATTNIAAQEVNLTFAPQGKGIAKTLPQQMLGSDGKNIVMITQSGILIKTLWIKSFDMEQNLQGEIELGHIKDNGFGLTCRQAIVNGSNIDLLMVDKDNDHLVATHERRNMATLALEGEPRVLADLKGNKNDQMYFFSAMSPDEKLVATATVKVEAGLGAEVKVALYSREMEEYWSMEVPAHGFSDILVNNEGEVALMGMEVENNIGTLQAIVTDGERSEFQSSRYNAHGMLVLWEPAYYGNGRLVATAAMRSEELSQGYINCMDAVSLDIKSGNVSIDRHLMSSEELVKLINEKGNSTKRKWLSYGVIEQVITDNEGAYVVVDGRWDTYSRYGLESRSRCGMMVLRVGADGHFKWVHTERYFMQVGFGGLNFIEYRWLPTTTGIMLVNLTNKKDAYRGPDETVKGVRSVKKAELTVTTLNREGTASKVRFASNKQGLLLYPTPLADNEWLFLLSRGFKSSFGKLTIK